MQYFDYLGQPARAPDGEHWATQVLWPNGEWADRLTSEVTSVTLEMARAAARLWVNDPRKLPEDLR